jgi:hypothetical protein
VVGLQAGTTISVRVVDGRIHATTDHTEELPDGHE